MSEEPSANLDITLDDKDVLESINRLLAEIKKLTDEFDKADKKIVTFADAVGDTTTTIKEIDQAATQTANTISAMGDDAAAASSDVEKIGQSSKGAAADLSSLGSSAQKADADTSKLGAGQRGTAADINRTGVAAKGTGADTSKMGNDARAAATRVDNLSVSSKQAANSIANLGANSKNTSASLRTVGTTAQGANRDVAAMSVSVLGLGQGITGVSDTAFGFQEKVVALQRSSFGLEQTTIDLRRAEEDYAKAISEGLTSKEDLARQEEDLATLRRDHAIEIEEVRTEQEALNAEYVTFAVNIAATAIQGHIAVTQALGAEKTALIASRTATILKSKAVQAAVFDVQKFRTTLYATTGANVAFGTSARVGASGVRFASAAVKGFIAAIGPVGWAIIGVTLAWEAWNSNLFGFRDAIKTALIELQKMFDTIKWLIPVIGLVDEAFKAFDPEGHARAAESVTTALHDIGTETEDVTIPAINDLNSSFQDGEEVLGSYVSAAGTATTTLGDTSGILVQVTNDIIKVNNELRDDPFSHVQASADTLFGTIASLSVQYDEGQISIENYNLALEDLSSTWKTIDKDFSTARGPNALHQEFLKIVQSTQALKNNLTNINEQLDITSKKNDFSNRNNGINTNSSNLPLPLSSSFTSIDAIRRQVLIQLNEDLRNVKNKAGTIITAEAQEGIFKFQARIEQIYQQNLYDIALASNDIRRDLIEIASFNEATQGNYANPNFVSGGGFTAGVRTNNKPRINRQRHQAFGNVENALGTFSQFFGYEPQFGGLPRRGKTGVLNARARALQAAVTNAHYQLTRFPVDLDYTPELRKTKIGTKTISYSRTVHNGRRVFGSRRENKYKNIFRAPTRREAVEEALRRSREIESFYNRILDEDENILGLVDELDLSRPKLYSYAQSDQDLIDLKGKLTFHDRILTESNAI